MLILSFILIHSIIYNNCECCVATKQFVVIECFEQAHNTQVRGGARMMRIGMLTSGGDCQALNAAMRGVVKGLSANVKDLEIYGFEN